jgi:monoamine oxidase
MDVATKWWTQEPQPPVERYMDGAVRSGERAASEVLAAL